jgi:nicotinamidase-related amidase
MGTLLSPPGAYAANLCIDMQNLFAPGGPWATPWMERVAPFVAALVERAPERTIFTRFIPPQTKESRHVEALLRKMGMRYRRPACRTGSISSLRWRAMHRRPLSSIGRLIVLSATASSMRF